MLLNQNILNNKDIKYEATRVGFGKALLDLGKENKDIVALCADLTESMQMHLFAKEYPDRFFEMGITEQSMASVASGMSAMGLMPFIGSYATFSPGRNWEQIRTTICYNDRKVIIVGGHTGLSVGPDGGTHQALEDIAIMRVLPNMNILSPIDSIEAYQMTRLAVEMKGPVYLRLAREKSPILLEDDYNIEDLREYKNNIIYTTPNEGDYRIGIIGTGPVLYEAIKTAMKYKDNIKIKITIFNLSIIKDENDKDKIIKNIINFANNQHHLISIEEHQINGGVGSLIAEILSEHNPKKLLRIGVKNRYGQSGNMTELYKEYNIDSEYITQIIDNILIHKY